MNTRTRRGSFLFILLAAVLLIASGCAPTRIGESWPVMDTVALNGKVRLLVAYNQIVTLVQPENGALARLENSEGEVRTDDQGNPRTWTMDGHQFDNAQFFARPVELGDNRMLFPAFNSRLLTVDMILAQPENNVGVHVAAPVIADVAVSDDTLYVPLKFGNVVALDRETYEEKWVAVTKTGSWSAPLLVDDVLYVSSVDHHLYAFNAATGVLIWAVDVEGVAGATPLFYDGFLYVGSFSHQLYKISTAGEIVATFKGNNWFWNTPVLFDGTLYAADLAGYVYALNPDDLTQIWGTKAASRGIRPAPLVTDEYVVAGSRDGKVYWLARATGEVVFSKELEGRPEILSDMLLLEPSAATEPVEGEDGEDAADAPELNITEPLVLVATTNNAHLVVAMPLDYTSTYPGWVYAR